MKEATRFLVLAILLLFAPSLRAQESEYPLFRHELQSTFLVGDKRGEHLIISRIEEPRKKRSTIAEIKVSEWGKPFSVTDEWTDHEEGDTKYRDTVVITVRETTDAEVMEAEFEHVRYRNGKQFLRFCGTTLLRRSDIHNT